jgi:hypothetical protein
MIWIILAFRANFISCWGIWIRADPDPKHCPELLPPSLSTSLSSMLTIKKQEAQTGKVKNIFWLARLWGGQIGEWTEDIGERLVSTLNATQ